MIHGGRRSWLVWTNLLLALIAQVPSFILLFLWLLHATGGLMLGELSAIPAVVGAGLLEVFGENYQIVAIPIFLACLFVPKLLVSTAIPRRVRAWTATLVSVSLLLMTVEMVLLRHAAVNGYFKGLFF